jgi:voltage-gated potassium channel
MGLGKSFLEGDLTRPTNKTEKIKKTIYNIIRDDDKNNLPSIFFHAVIIILIFINVAAVFLNTFDDIRILIEPYYSIINTISIIVFTIEYILRVWTASITFPNLSFIKSRLKYYFTAKALIDFLVLFSFYLPLLFFTNIDILRTLRLFRIFSLIKINRYSKALSLLGLVIRKKSAQLLSSIFIVSILLIFASLLMFYIENDAQPGAFDNAFSSLWWAISALTTVGYGDIYPITTIGKLLGIIISLMGIALIAIPTGIISAGFRSVDEKDTINSDKKYCSYCGNKLQ